MIDLFHQLDERINSVATKVLHLGDQLESVNIPRARAVEAQKLMRHFSEFLSPGPLTDPIFTDKTSVSLLCLKNKSASESKLLNSFSIVVR